MKPTDVPRLTDDSLIRLSESQSARVPTAPVASPAIRGERLDGPQRKRSASPAPLSAAYERLGRSVALLGALAVALGLWIAGAFFTLQFLTRMGVPLTVLGSLQWLIPVVISAAELFFWPQRGSRPSSSIGTENRNKLVTVRGTLSHDILDTCGSLGVAQSFRRVSTRIDSPESRSSVSASFDAVPGDVGL